MTNYKLNGYIPDPANKVYIPFDKSKISTPSINDVDLRPFSPPLRHDQGQTSSCVGNGTARALEIKRNEKFGVENHIPLSRMDIYFSARDLMDPKQSNVDEGTNICLAMDALRIYGICREETWPWDPNKINQQPSLLSTREDFLNKISGHFKIDSTGNDRIDAIILNLKNKNPVVFGMQVGEEFETYTSNSEPISKCTNSKGGHCTTLVGFINGLFIGENSWANNWGQNGFYFIDPLLIGSNIASDFWVMQTDYDIYWENKGNS